MLSTNLENAVMKLPKQLREQLHSCPSEGNGVHSWLFKTALRLHDWIFEEWLFEDEIAEVSEDQIVELLDENLSCQRPEREIRDAVVNAGRYFRGEIDSVSQKQWPAVDYASIHKTVLDCRVRLKDLPGLSPVNVSDKEPMTEEILDALYPGNPLLCFAQTPHAPFTRPREIWRGRESEFAFIVPNPMTKEIGVKTDGKSSRRCLDNTGLREFLVIEFDITDSGSWAPYVEDWKRRGISKIDANVALIVELATEGLPRLPLALAVHSGGKSVHAWFPCSGLGDEQIRFFMDRAVRLGADRTTWTRCQFVRMPDGTRDNGNRQQVYYFAPNVVGLEE